MKIILFLCFILSISPVIACLVADQNRMFPVGISPSGLVVVEVHMHRGEKTTESYEMIPVWGGTGYLNVYDKNYKLISSKTIDEFAHTSDVEDEISQIFRKGSKLAKKIDGLIPAKPLEIYFCDYLQNCSKAQFAYDSIIQQPYVMLGNRKYAIPILFDSTSIASNYLNYYSSFEPEDAAYMQNLGINSVRQFQLGDQVLTIVHLGCGQHDSDEKEHAANFKFEKLEESIFPEYVLHHGHGFDFFVME